MPQNTAAPAAQAQEKADRAGPPSTVRRQDDLGMVKAGIHGKPPREIAERKEGPVVARKKSIQETVGDLSQPVPEAGCWIWMGAVSPDGYPVITRDGKQKRGHRLSYEAFVGPIEHGLFVCHRCDQPLCVNPAHLFLGTHQENMDDMRRKGRDPVGSTCRNTPLSDKSAMEIYEASGSTRQIAMRFGVSETTVWRIKTKRYWKHIHGLRRAA